jgi:O-antigen ligase
LRFGSVISSLRGRVEIWAGFLNRPWHELVVGYGKGSSTPLFGMEEAHNFYIRLLTEVGVPGLIAFVMIIAVVVRMSLRLYQTGETPIIQSVGFACVGTSITLLIIAGVQDVFINVKVAEMYWMLVGATAAAYRFTVVDK